MSSLQYDEFLSSLDNEPECTDLDSTECSCTLIQDGDESGADCDRASSVEERWRVADIASALPSLYPCYIPYEAQHLVLTTVQTVLEACCFDFAKQWLPGLVREHRWDCAAAVELNRWTQFLDERTLSGLKLDTGIDGPALRAVLVEIRNLRDVAVYRVPTTARGISRLLQYAKKFASVLKDSRRTETIGRIKEIVDDKIYLLELNKKVLESTANRKLHVVREQCAVLIRQEEEIVAEMLQLDLERRKLAGQVLQHSIEKLVDSSQRQQQR